MKLLLSLSLGICLATSSCLAAPKVLSEAQQTAKIAQVKSGALKTAHASWWGFDKTDAANCLQQAINSGVPKLIVDDMGSDWIIGKPLQLVSNQEIIFEDGVVIQAKKGEFHGKKDSLFNGHDLTNIALIGKGNATLRMHRDDYANPDLYTKAEWRSGIALWDCQDVVIRGLTVTETGGDGLYLGARSDGFNKNVLVENCTFDRNYRQGISVISAVNLIIRNCRLTNTKGTAPQAGIDFEPNASRQRLVNCLVENSTFSGNAGGGIGVYPFNLKSKSQPISITIRNCSFANSDAGLTALATRAPQDSVTGQVLFENCTFDHNSIRIRNAIVGSATYLFENCRLDFSVAPDGKMEKNKYAPITLAMERSINSGAMGGITFKNTVVEICDRPVIDIRYSKPINLSDQIAGGLLVECDGKTKPFDIAGFIQQEQEHLAKFKLLTPALYNPDALKAPATGEPRERNSGMYTRGEFTFLQYAQQGEQVTLNVTARKVYARETKVELYDPSGKKLQTYTIPYDNKPFPITFTAQQTGIYRLVRTQDFSQRIDINSSRPGNGFLIEGGMDFLPTTGTLYFEVPAGVKQFSIGISTNSSADVALLNPRGEVVQPEKGLQSFQLLSATRPDASESEVWSIKITNAIWAVNIQFYGDLEPIVSTNPATLFSSK